MAALAWQCSNNHQRGENRKWHGMAINQRSENNGVWRKQRHQRSVASAKRKWRNSANGESGHGNESVKRNMYQAKSMYHLSA